MTDNATTVADLPLREGYLHPDVSYSVMVDTMKRYLNLNVHKYSPTPPQISDDLRNSLEALWYEAYRRGSGASEDVSSVRECLLRVLHDEERKRLSEELLSKLALCWEEAVACGRGEMCNHCGSREGVKFEDSRTCYSPSEKDPYPNASIPLCRACAERHHDYWNEMWAEYYYDRL